MCVNTLSALQLIIMNKSLATAVVRNLRSYALSGEDMVPYGYTCLLMHTNQAGEITALPIILYILPHLMTLQQVLSSAYLYIYKHSQ